MNIQLTKDPGSLPITYKFSNISWRLIVDVKQNITQIYHWTFQNCLNSWRHRVATACKRYLTIRETFYKNMVLREQTTLRTFEERNSIAKSMRKFEDHKRQYRKIFDSIGQVTGDPSFMQPHIITLTPVVLEWLQDVIYHITPRTSIYLKWKWRGQLTYEPMQISRNIDILK